MGRCPGSPALAGASFGTSLVTSRDPDLARDCERALFIGARSARVGTRQQVRAAARRFVRGHRRDRALLARVLHGALASAAFAAAILGLAPGAASADAPLLVERTGAQNPFDGADVGAYASPALGDLDGDGDLDVVIGRDDGGFAFYENTGTRVAPAFVQRTGAANPLDGADVGSFASPALGDSDADGDLDLVSGREDGTFAFFENAGTRVAPSFVERTGAMNPLDGRDVGLFSAPSFVDLDSDGDPDLVSGDLFGRFRLFENTGDATTASFVERVGPANPFDGGDLGTFSTPDFGDLDGDGDPELVTGESSGAFFVVDNAGDAVSLAPELLPDAASPLDGAAVGGGSSRPALGDLDGDGDLDAVAGSGEGTLAFFENQSGAFVERTGAANPLDFGVALPLSNTTPALADVDGDGDLDFFAGETAGSIAEFENVGTESDPVYVERTGAGTLFAGLELSGHAYPAPAFADFDADGDFDVVVGLDFFDSASDSSFFYLRNDGTSQSAGFVFLLGSSNPLSPIDPGLVSVPTAGDFDADGDADLVVGTASGTLSWLENTGPPGMPAFTLRTGAANPLDGFDVGAFARPGMGDVDGDRDLDVIVGSQSNGFDYFENVGTTQDAQFALRLGADDPIPSGVGFSASAGLGDVDGDGDLDLVSGSLGGEFHFFENAIVEPAPRARLRSEDPLDAASVSSDARPALGDLDGDGDLDLVTGEFAGTFSVFENTGHAVAPIFTELTGAESPLDGEDVGFAASPSLGDLDGDGDLDLVAGENGGTFLYYENTGSATTAIFTARVGASNPLDGEDVGIFAEPVACDLDGDGDLDLVSAAGSGLLRYFENTGSATSPAFVERTGGQNPFDPVAYGVRSPALGDVDHDGDLDLVTGDFYGTFHYFENTGDATAPAFTERTGMDDPLDGEDVGSYSSPALGDLDADGDLEIVVGRYAGDFVTYTLPEPGGPLAWGAALLLLRRLARLRGSSSDRDRRRRRTLASRVPGTDVRH